VQKCANSDIGFSTSAPAAPTPRAVQNPIPMDIDATKKKGVSLPVCYCCGEPGHLKPQCLKRFNIRHMMTEEVDEWMQQKAIERDVAELKEVDVEEGFPSNVK